MTSILLSALAFPSFGFPSEKQSTQFHRGDAHVKRNFLHCTGNLPLIFRFLKRSRASSHYVNERKTSGKHRTGRRTEGNAHENLEQVVGVLSMGDLRSGITG